VSAPTLELRAGGRKWTASPDSPPVFATVGGSGAVEVLVQGEGPWALTVGGRPETLLAWGPGWRWAHDRRLSRVQGPLPVVVTRADITLRIELEVVALKLGPADILVVLDELDGIAAALGGPGQGEVRSADAVLDLLERDVGGVSEAAASVGRRPLVRRQERVRAAPTTHARLGARDVRWLARHPAAALRAGGGARDVTVVRTVTPDHDLPENRGALGVLDQLERALTDAAGGLEATRRRAEARAALMGAAPTPTEGEVPRQAPGLAAALAVRRQRAARLADEVAAARARLGMPPTLRPSPAFPLTHGVAAHPGYWRLHDVGRRLATLDADGPRGHTPIADLDTLYERFVGLRLAAAVADWAGVPLAEALRVRRDGWSIALRTGTDGGEDDATLRLSAGAYEVALRLEPQYAHGDRVGRLSRGRPWTPDAVLEVRRQGHVSALHVFDAKHRREPGRADDEPLDALREVWLRYGDDLGDPDTGLPLVSSVWVVYPGPRATVRPRVPTMLAPHWPADRLRGGTVSLPPSDAAGPNVLRALVAAMLDATLGAEGPEPVRIHGEGRTSAGR
jgi:hypothetical protein